VPCAQEAELRGGKQRPLAATLSAAVAAVAPGAQRSSTRGPRGAGKAPTDVRAYIPAVCVCAGS
jgi:hypothetical protein